MRASAVFPQLEIGTDPDVIAKYGRTVEALGYERLVIFDHVLGADPNRPGGWTGAYDHRSAFHEPLVLFGYLAAITTRLKLATAILVLPQRQTALVAKQAAEVDVLSGGRFVFQNNSGASCEDGRHKDGCLRQPLAFDGRTQTESLPLFQPD